MKKARVMQIAILSVAMMGLAAAAAAADEVPRMKMTTDIPESIKTPDKVETRIGRLEFFDGFPTEDTARRNRTLRKHESLVMQKR